MRGVLIVACVALFGTSAPAQTLLASVDLGAIFGTTVLGTVQIDAIPIDADGDPQTIELLGRDRVTGRYKMAALRGGWCAGDWFEATQGSPLATAAVRRVGDRDMLAVTEGSTLHVYALTIPVCGS